MFLSYLPKIKFSSAQQGKLRSRSTVATSVPKVNPAKPLYFDVGGGEKNAGKMPFEAQGRPALPGVA
jgi:hypothetical protein